MLTKSQFEEFSEKYNPVRLVFGTSRGYGTYGQNTVSCHAGGRRYLMTGGGYDLTASAIGEWLSNCPEFQEGCKSLDPRKFYGLRIISPSTGKELKHYRPGCKIWIDGGCGEYAVSCHFRAATGGRLDRVEKSARGETYLIRRER